MNSPIKSGTRNIVVGIKHRLGRNKLLFGAEGIFYKVARKRAHTKAFGEINMSKLAELLAQKVDLEKKIEAAKIAEQADAIKQIVDITSEYGITHAQLKPHMTKRRKRRSNTLINAS